MIDGLIPGPTTLEMPPLTDIVPLYPHPHKAPNEIVTLYEGPVGVPGCDGGTGRLVLRWMPTASLRLEAELSSMKTPHAGDRLDVAVADSTAEVLFSSIHTGTGPSGPFARVSGTVSTFDTGLDVGLQAMGFQVVNFNDFLTPGPKPAPVFGYPPQVADLRSGGWRVRLTAVPQSRQLFKSLDTNGGYAFTHLGRLEREDGSSFAVQDAQGVLEALRWFLCFARGAACGLPVRWGVSADDAVVWRGWSSPVVDVWKGRDTWFDEHHGNLLQELFPAFTQCVADTDLWPALRLALHWYQKCNTRAGGMEGAIILGLTALDLLGALVVVDKCALMSDAKYDKKLNASEKLARLLDVLKVRQANPAKLTELSAFAAANGWTSASETLAEIRHGYVHSNRKRRQVVLSAPNLAVFQAWQLSLWYQELALLFLLDHQGEYRNRITAEWLGQVETVPWALKPSPATPGTKGLCR